MYVSQYFTSKFTLLILDFVLDLNLVDTINLNSKMRYVFTGSDIISCQMTSNHSYIGSAISHVTTFQGSQENDVIDVKRKRHIYIVLLVLHFVPLNLHLT